MKKLLSIITAVSVAASMMSAISVSAEDKITADEVREMICSTGLSSRPDLWDKPAVYYEDADVLNSAKTTVKDVINIDTSYAWYTLEKSDEKYVLNDKCGDCKHFWGINNKNKHISVQEYPNGDMEWSERGETANEDDEEARLENYEWIAEVINESDIADIAEIKPAFYAELMFANTWFIYVKDKAGKEYAFYTDDTPCSVRVGVPKDVVPIKRGEILPLDEFCKLSEAINQAFEADEPQLEIIEGDEVRDTDTRTPYIGMKSKFVDVEGDLISYVNELVDLGIINGYDDNTFRPDNTITRGEAAAMIARMMQYEGSYSGEFLDVSKSDWYADEVSALVINGIINGYDETTFAPQNDIKYQEVMKILSFALGYIFYNPELYPEMTNEQAIQLGLTDGLSGFDTTAPITRGDMAVMISNALDIHLKTTLKAIDSPDGTYAVFVHDITLIDYINGGRLNGHLRKPINFDE